ncbi:glycoside hydrolase domain-containing protein [Hyphomicrobium sp. 99]|uniref:glycoside hydrolase domain-containing protein n=1 Tax=Hyphomicrobium sp. 99 TaxID=1163419 RepID=UPI0018CECBDD|nr:glycoside hydrolase domain-containing protein [Hyphomicrobium sp. 99]
MPIGANLKLPGHGRRLRTRPSGFQAGIRIWAIYQDRQNRLSDFTHSKGRAAGASALGYAQNTIKQPSGSAIYFSVDFDPSMFQVGQFAIQKDNHPDI